MFKRLWSFIIIFIFGIIIFTGCIARENTSHGVVTVTLSGWSNLQEKQLLQQVLNDFEAVHPRIKVKYDVIADEYMDVLKIRLIGDTAADVFYLDALEAPGLIEPGVLEPLDSYVTPEFDIADFQPGLLAAFQQNRKTYGFPKDFSTLVLFYNKQAFAEVGLLQPPQTWQELREYSKKLTVDQNKDGRIDRYGFGVIPELARQYFMIKAFGGELINASEQATFASPESLQGLQLVVDQYRQDQSSAQPSDAGTTSGSEIFGQGKAAMVIEGPWLIPYLDETFPNLKYATAEVPTIAGKKGTMAYTVAYVEIKEWVIAFSIGQQGFLKPAPQNIKFSLVY